jgi:hypothetical protein
VLPQVALTLFKAALNPLLKVSISQSLSKKVLDMRYMPVVLKIFKISDAKWWMACYSDG